jgi:hypothetical protein
LVTVIYLGCPLAEECAQSRYEPTHELFGTEEYPRSQL